MSDVTQTDVVIVGAGPAGLVLAQLLALEGVRSVVLESRSREHIEWRQRAGGLEPGTVDTLRQLRVPEVEERLRQADEWRARMAASRTGSGFVLRFRGEDHELPIDELAGTTMTGYAQQHLVQDLVAARIKAGGDIRFEVTDVSLHGLDSESPHVQFRHDGRSHEVHARLIAGCDGFHGVSRAAIPPQHLTVYQHEYPFAWLAVTADVVPTRPRAVYAYHEDGFAMHSIRAPAQTRLYLQIDRNDPIEAWPDERIWAELHHRLATSEGDGLEEGPIVQKSVAPLRSFVVDPMQWGRLYLAGDAAHIVPPTGAKGLNLAVSDVRVLAPAMTLFVSTGDDRLLRSYSATCLRRVWRVQDFSTWLTDLLHRSWDDPTGFDHQRRLARLGHVCRSESAARDLAENYFGVVEL